jgi:hypothetical protein
VRGSSSSDGAVRVSRAHARVFGSDEAARRPGDEEKASSFRPRQSRHRTCGAHARSTGKPCKAPGTGRGGRCRMHGGLSTGPRTAAGLAKCLEAMRAGKQAARAAREAAPTETMRADARAAPSERRK